MGFGLGLDSDWGFVEAGRPSTSSTVPLPLLGKEAGSLWKCFLRFEAEGRKSLLSDFKDRPFP